MGLYSSKALLLLLAMTAQTVSAFSPVSLPTHNGLSTSVSDFKSNAVSFRLPSTAPATNEAKGSDQSITGNTLDLSHYDSSRSFNLALEDIAHECTSSSKTKNIDVISRATIAEALVAKLEAATADTSSPIPFHADVVTYNTLMKVWARAAQTLADGRGRGDINAVMHAMDDVPEELTHGGVYTAKDAAERACKILSDLEIRYLTGQTTIAPNTFGYNIVMDGLHKCGAKDAPARVQEIFDQMNKWSDEGVTEAVQGYHDDEDVEYVNADAEKWTQIKPDAITYSVCMETLGQSKEDDAMEKVEGLLASIEAVYEATNDQKVKPVTRVANSAINAYLRHGTNTMGGYTTYRQVSQKNWLTAKNVHEILNKCNRKFKETGDDSYKPDIQTITMVIDAYARCCDIAATERAEYLFEHSFKQWKQHGDSKLKPSSRTFTVMINAWAKTRDPRSPEKAEALLSRMEKMYESDVKDGHGTTSKVKPSIRTYTAAMGAWVRSRDDTKPQRALRILKKVNEMYKESKDKAIKPTLFTYNIAIDACARCNGGPEQQANALKIAFAVNKAIMAANIEPNHITYSTLLKCATKLLPPGDQRNTIVKAIFAKCTKKGFVDTNVLKALEQAADRNLYYELMGLAADRNGHVRFDEVPKEWSKNVVKGRQY